MFQPNTMTRFTDFSERLLINRWLRKSGLNWKDMEKVNYQHLWLTFIRKFENNSKLAYLIQTIKKDIPLDRALAIPYYDNISLEKLIYYLAVMRTDANAQAFYIPKSKVKATIYYFAAKDSLVSDRQNWCQYTLHGIIFYNIKGTHFSIFHKEYVGGCAMLFNRELNKVLSKKL
jgi:hypothetical protein